jgi:hypothetical protein
LRETACFHAHGSQALEALEAFESGIVALSGLKPKSRVHGLGDGAPWIAEQMDIQFGAQGSYLIDFYHLCDYLAAAAPSCSKTPKVWLEEQKARFKSGRNAEALAALEPYVEPKEQAETPVRNAYRYISKLWTIRLPVRN